MTQPAPAAAAKPRLVIELTSRTAADLDWLVAAEELNKTTVTNRAIQVYRLLVESQRDGTQTIQHKDGETPTRLVIV
jgi:hypothetical protein